MLDTRFLSPHSVSMKYWDWFQTNDAMRAFSETLLANHAGMATMSRTEIIAYISIPEVIQAFREMFTRLMDHATSAAATGEPCVQTKINIRVFTAAYFLLLKPNEAGPDIVTTQTLLLQETTTMIGLIDAFALHWATHKSFAHIAIDTYQQLHASVSKYTTLFQLWKNPNHQALYLDTLKTILGTLAAELQAPGTTSDTNMALIRGYKTRIMAYFDGRLDTAGRAAFIQDLVAQGFPDPDTI